MSKVKPVRTVDEFLQKIREIRSKVQSPGKLLFRGQARPWPLLPRSGRKSKGIANGFSKDDLVYREGLQLQNFMQEAFSVHPLMQLPDAGHRTWHALTLLQHYGGATRLLDWSFNPLVALFFAVDGKEENLRPTVYIRFHEAEAQTIDNLCHQHPLGPATFMRSDWERNEQDRCFILSPPSIDGRVVAQTSLFSFSLCPWIPLRPHVKISLSWSRSALDEYRRDLEDLLVTRRSLFPDLQGIAQWAGDERIWNRYNAPTNGLEVANQILWER